MNKLTQLYVMELTREGAAMTIDDVPAGLRKQVAEAVEERGRTKTPNGEDESP